jgi:hypothetical protein
LDCNLTNFVVVLRLARSLKFAFPALVASILFGCQIGAEIEVRTIGGVTIFAVTRDDREPACVSSINVSESNATISSASKWSLNQNYADVQAGKKVCNHLFVFGKPLKGYGQQYDGKPLKPGKTYYVSIGGGGLTGDRTFTIVE